MKFLIAAAVAASGLMAVPLWADGLMVEDAYLRASRPDAPSAAAFFTLMNHSGVDDRLVGVSSDVAEKVELHSHTEDANGVMRMGEIEGGVAVAAGESHHFARGGDHVMFMGVNTPLEQGAEVRVTLQFEHAGAVEVVFPVDHARKPDHGAMKHGTMKHD
ncbi:MAG: copper chaperone PCu(A)C [Sulfitobacter sp.]